MNVPSMKNIFTSITSYKFVLLWLFFGISISISVIIPNTVNAAFGDMPQTLAADGTGNVGSNAPIIHLSNRPNDKNGVGGVVDEVGVKLYYPGATAPLPGDDSLNLTIPRLAGYCDPNAGSQVKRYNLKISNVGGSDDVSPNSDSTCTQIRFTIPRAWFSNVTNTSEGKFITASVSIKLQRSDTIMDINYIKSYGSTRLGFVQGLPVPVDINAYIPPEHSGESAYNEYKITSVFGVPCNQSVKSKIFWQDDDYQLDPEKWADGSVHDNLEVRVKLKDGGYVTNTPPSWGQRKTGSIGVGLVKGGSYYWVFDNVTRGNVINLIYPYDSANFYLSECSPNPDGWSAGWSYTGIEGGDSNGGTQVGNVDIPDTQDAPKVGQNFRFLNIARNNGDLSLTGPYTTGGDSYSDGTYNFLHFGKRCKEGENPALVACTGTLYANTGGNINISNTLIDNRESSVSGTGYRGYTTAADNNIADPWNNDWGSFTVAAADGGRVRCVNTSVSPTQGTRAVGSPYDAPESDANPDKNEKWTYGSGSLSSTLCVNVPYYYILEPTATGAPPATVQQGENIVANGTVKNPLQTGSRQHTDSEVKDKGIVELIVPNGVAPPKGAALNPATFVSATKDPCQYMLTKASGSCSVRARDNTNSVTAGGAGLSLSTTRSGANDDGSEAYDIGTKYCYATYTQHYKNTNSSDVGPAGDDDYSYGPINCTAVVKKPKVQFLNTDVTVGKGISDGASCSVVNGAPIITASAAGGNSLYGSWVEYGAFATGTISNFGSSAYPYGLPSSQTLSNRLLFGNYNGTSFVANGNQGDYDYNNKCLPETSQYVKDTDITKLNTNPAYSVTLPDGSEYPAYINATGQVRLDRLVKREDDKTGYVADGGKGIQFGVEPTDTSEDVGSGSAAVAGTYKVNQCTTNTNTPPDGWTFSSTPNQAGSHSGGCNDGGNYLKAWLAANIQNSDSSGWTFTAPANTTIKSLKADRIMKAAPAAAYRDTFAYLDAPGIHQGCTPFLGCTGATGNTTLFNNAAVSNVKFWVYCSVDAASSAIYYSDANIGCRNDAGETSYALSNIELTLNDGSVPSLNPSGSFRANTGKELTYTVSDTGSGVNKVDVVTKKADDATAPEISLYSAIPDSNGGKCDSSDAAVPVPCPLNVAKTVDIDTSALDDGVYDITMTATDKANNKDVKTWKYTVNNALPANTDAFKDRDIVLYSKKKDPNVPCNTGVNIGTGDIRIYQNIEFQQYGYNGISELPRLVLVADCNIIIHRSVDRVYASLVAGDAIKTCDVQSKSKDICQKALTIKGGISAKRLLLWRTANADLKAGDPTIPAESFNVSPSQIITKYNRGYRSSSATTANEVDLPPRY